jgi:GNAT superfamily N-acetyltransferase
MDVEVRRAVAVDAPLLARLRWQWRGDERGEVGLVDRESFIDYFTTWTVDHLATHLPFLAEVQGRPVGMAWLVLSNRTPSPTLMDRRAGDVQSVYIAPELRGRGVGAKLMDALLQHARDLELVYLTVHSAATATGFYAKLGFFDDNQWMAYRIDQRSRP